AIPILRRHFLPVNVPDPVSQFPRVVPDPSFALRLTPLKFAVSLDVPAFVPRAVGAVVEPIPKADPLRQASARVPMQLGSLLLPPPKKPELRESAGLRAVHDARQGLTRFRGLEGHETQSGVSHLIDERER